MSTTNLKAIQEKALDLCCGAALAAMSAPIDFEGWKDCCQAIIAGRAQDADRLAAQVAESAHERGEAIRRTLPYPEIEPCEDWADQTMWAAQGLSEAMPAARLSEHRSTLRQLAIFDIACCLRNLAHYAADIRAQIAAEPGDIVLRGPNGEANEIARLEQMAASIHRFRDDMLLV